MRIRNLLFALMLAAPSAGFAQEIAAPAEAAKPTLQQQLMPEATAKLLAPAPEAKDVEDKSGSQPMMQSRGSASGMIIAGAALFIAGLVIGGSAGTVVAVAGAAIGAYGLYLYF